jgi:hypothetical protein
MIKLYTHKSYNEQGEPGLVYESDDNNERSTVFKNKYSGLYKLKEIEVGDVVCVNDSWYRIIKIVDEPVKKEKKIKVRYVQGEITVHRFFDYDDSVLRFNYDDVVKSGGFESIYAKHIESNDIILIDDKPAIVWDVEEAIE